jgi:hypothetical protein
MKPLPFFFKHHETCVKAARPGLSARSWLTGLLVALLPCAVGAQDGGPRKHPRVSELEDFLHKEANDYLKGRFPGHPLLVKVKAEAMHRSSRYDGGTSKESLPYMDLEQEEIRDEWDDPSQSLYSLMNRVRRIEVAVALPDSVTDSEVEETKENLVAALKLLEGRDTVAVTRKAWVKNDNTILIGVSSLLIAVFALVLGMYFVNRGAIGRIAEAIGQLKTGLGADASSGSGAATAASTPSSDNDTPARSTNEVSLSDPLKLREYLHLLVEKLEEKKGFPNRFDFFELDELGRRSASHLGSVIVELTLENQKRIFGMTGDAHWLEAFSSPGSSDSQTIEVVQKLVRSNRDPGSAHWDKLIVQVWRLTDEQRDSLLKEFEKEEVFMILRELPKGEAVRMARKLYPGAWAPVLEHSTEKSGLSEARIKQMLARALEILPEASLTRVEAFHEQRALLQYIRTATVTEEREVYAVLPNDSEVPQKRPPFFPVFALAADALKELALEYSPDQWAMALLDVEMSDRRKIEECFSEKQRFLFSERLKHYDAHPPARERVAQLREQIGLAVFQRSRNPVLPLSTAAVAAKRTEPAKSKGKKAA